MMKLKMRNENGEELEFEGDEKAFSVVVGQLSGGLFDRIRSGHGARSAPATASKRTSDAPTVREMMTTSAIAARLGCKRGLDLFMAAAAKLTLYDGKDTFTRSEVLKEMSLAIGFFTENYRKNLSKYIRKLISDRRLNERSKDLYALAMETRTDISRKLDIPLPQ